MAQSGARASEGALPAAALHFRPRAVPRKQRTDGLVPTVGAAPQSAAAPAPAPAEIALVGVDPSTAAPAPAMESRRPRKRFRSLYGGGVPRPSGLRLLPGARRALLGAAAPHAPAREDGGKTPAAAPASEEGAEQPVDQGGTDAGQGGAAPAEEGDAAAEGQGEAAAAEQGGAPGASLDAFLEEIKGIPDDGEPQGRDEETQEPRKRRQGRRAGALPTTARDLRDLREGEVFDLPPRRRRACGNPPRPLAEQ